jgi:hypothetical protein
MPSRPLCSLLTLLIVVCSANAFVAPVTGKAAAVAYPSTGTAFFAKKPKEDLSYIETRDMSREEMLDLNRQNEEIMNMELSMMTGFSLVLSLPILYLCWVAFFSD